MPPAGLDPIIPANKQPQSYTLERTATGIGYVDKFSARSSSSSSSSSSSENASNFVYS